MSRLVEVFCATQRHQKKKKKKKKPETQTKVRMALSVKAKERRHMMTGVTICQLERLSMLLTLGNPFESHEVLFCPYSQCSYLNVLTIFRPPD